MSPLLCCITICVEPLPRRSASRQCEIAADLADVDAGKRCSAGLVGIEFELAQAGAGIALHHHLGGADSEKLPKPSTVKLLPTAATELPDSTPPPAT